MYILGLRRLTRTGKINEESEAYSGLLGDPVVDKNGKPIPVKSFFVASDNASNNITTNANANANSDNQTMNPFAGSSGTDNLNPSKDYLSQNADNIKKPDIDEDDD